MTQKNGQEPENLKWMEIAESDAVNEVRRSRSRLPYVVAAIALVAVGGGAIFAQTNPLEPDQVTPTSVVTSVAITPPVVVNGIPTIPPVAGGGGYDEDEDEDDEEDDDDDDEEEDDD